MILHARKTPVHPRLLSTTTIFLLSSPSLSSPLLERALVFKATISSQPCPSLRSYNPQSSRLNLSCAACLSSAISFNSSSRLIALPGSSSTSSCLSRSGLINRVKYGCSFGSGFDACTWAK